jgi:hypothetical protein
MPSDESPDQMTPRERFHEIAAILAKGVLRLRAATGRQLATSSMFPAKSDSPKNCLDLSVDPSPHVQGG